MANAGMEGKASHVVQRSNASSRQRFQPARRTVKITAPVPAQSEPASTGASVLLTWPLTTGFRLTPPSLATFRLPTAEASHMAATASTRHLAPGTCNLRGWHFQRTMCDVRFRQGARGVGTLSAREDRNFTILQQEKQVP